MSNKTRKHIWPVSLVMSIAIIGALAAFLVLASNPGDTQAHGAGDHANQGWPACADMTDAQRAIHNGIHANVGSHGTMDPCPTTGNGGNGDMMMPDAGDTIKSDSTTASGAPEIKLTIDSLPKDLPVGSTIVLYLEDDFAEPDSIPMTSVYLAAMNQDGTTTRATGSGARVYVTSPVKIKTGAYFDEDKKDIAIRVLVPDMCADTSTAACEGPNGLAMGQKVTLVIESDSGIKNPSEAGIHSVFHDVVATDESLPSASNVRDRNDALRKADKDADISPGAAGGMERVVETVAKITLSDVDNKRGYEMTVTGSGFNDGTSADVYVLHYPAADNADKTTWPSCDMIIDSGTSVGGALVGSDDKVAVTFEVTAPTFRAGKNNYICMKDGEGLTSDTDVEDFDLQASIKVVPSSVNTGDTVNVFAQDYPGGSFMRLAIAGEVLWMYDAEDNAVSVSRGAIQSDGSGTATFEVPGGLEGVLKIEATWGTTKKDTKITIAGAQLNASKTDALPNETITITGNGFGTQTCISEDDITLDNVPVIVDEESLAERCGGNGVEVSNSGQFVATITLWPDDEMISNPTLIPGTHTLRVEDGSEYSAEVSITIAEPVVKVTPDVAGPRDYITITGENWPVDNPESDSPQVTIVVTDGPRDRTYTVFADAVGRVSQEHRVHRNVAIPSNVQVKLTHGTIAKIGSFDVPASTITVTPGEGQPGDTISLSAGNMPVYNEVDYVEVGGTRYDDPGVNTDRDGNVTIDDVLIPGLDPGVYSVVIAVGGNKNRTIAIGEVNVLAESSAAGAPAMLPGAVESLGDNLVAIFHFDDVGKSWSFYDPRPEFADLNTLTEMVNGEAYWILVSETVDDVVLNNKARSLTCRGADCWNLEVW